MRTKTTKGIQATAVVLLLFWIEFFRCEDVTKEDEPALQTRDLFKDSNIYKCNIEGNKRFCGKEATEEINKDTLNDGPRNQRVHLSLPWIHPTKVGHERNVSLIANKTHVMRTISVMPPIFEIEDFLDDDECDYVIEVASDRMAPELHHKQHHVKLDGKSPEDIMSENDADSDGKLDLKEFSDALGFSLTEEETMMLLIESKIDKDGDGKISLEELESKDVSTISRALDNLKIRRHIEEKGGIMNTWLWHDEDELLMYEGLLEDYHQRVSNLTQIPIKLVEQSEPLQVMAVNPEVSTGCQQDSAYVTDDTPCCVYGTTNNCRSCRYMSLSIFLNDVAEGGELVFPLANNDTFSWSDLHKNTMERCVEKVDKSRSNVIITPKRGKAILWYNHLVDAGTGWLGQMEPLSFYGHAATHGNEPRWMATMWLNIIGDGVTELRPWRMGTNWMSATNRNNDVIDVMRNDDFIEGQPYLHINNKYSRYLNEATEEAHATSAPVDDLKSQIEIGMDFIRGSLVDGSLSENQEQESRRQQTIPPQMSIQATPDAPQAYIKPDLPPASKGESTPRSAPIGVPEGGDELNRKDEGGFVPLGPPPSTANVLGSKPSGHSDEHRLVKAAMLLLEELERDELEIIARVLHDKLQLACIPLMVNPVGRI